MIFDNLVTEITPIQIIGDKDKDITNIAIDSRLVKNSGLFIAVKGSETDGHLYINRAIEGGATAVICEQLPKDLKNGITYIQLEDTHTALGIIADSFYNHPSKCLKLVGVTGTNGKTTIATLLYQLFKKLGYKAGLISTVCNYINDNAIAATHTTPDAITLNKLLREMVDAGCDYAFMEVSSHAIDQKRINGVNFVGGIFTNLTRDHLDYHGSVENYLKAKKAFFDNLPKEAFSLTNIDDRNGLVMTQNSASQKCTYSLKKLADFKGKILESHFEGMLLDFNSHELAVQFIGDFNAANLLAVYGAAKLLGEDEKEILIAISALKPVSGRFESLKSPKGYTAIVDYAHTPDALINVLDSIHKVLQNRGKVITVVGAGGNRDTGKRPIMAKESALRSDKLILTSDNPRFEEPDAIIDDMIKGLSKEDLEKTIVITNRKEAIKTACMLAQKNDVILVAGKGHETYQDVKGTKHHFDDKEVINTIIQQ